MIKKPTSERSILTTSNASDAPLLESIRSLVERQAEAWRRNDFDLAVGDSLPHGVLTSPGGEFPASILRATMDEFHAGFADLEIAITEPLCVARWQQGRHRMAVERDVPPRSVRGVTADAIIVDLVDGKILSWREYFDLAGSVEA